MFKETEILNRQQFREWRSHTLKMRECHSVQNGHLEKRHQSCSFLWLYQRRIKPRKPQSCFWPTERTGGAFLLQWEDNLGYLNCRIGLRSDIMPSWKSLAELWSFLESKGDAPRMTDCSERKLCKNFLTPLSFIQERTRRH